jgi:diguanylate cyclase (GGDEF)-like protein/PAS domain S-box-containing protein
MAAGAARAVEFRAQRKDGTQVPVWVMARPIVAADGTITGVVGTAVDISARVEAEEAAAAAANRLAVVGSIGSIGTWEWDLATGTLAGDRSLSDMHGTDPDAGWSIDMWLEAIHPDDRAAMVDAVNVDFATGLLTEVKYRVVKPDGSVRVVVGRGLVTQWLDGEPAKLGGIVLDITDSQRDAQRVLDNLETMSDGYLSLDEEFRVDYVNAAGERLLGETRENMIGRSLWEVFPDAVDSVFEHHYRAAMATGAAIEFEAYFPPHEAWYEVRAYPSDGTLAIYFRNINDRRARLEAQQRTLAAERSARLATEAASKQLEHAATHDPLTGLANRVALERHLATSLAARDSLAVMFCDLDRFKNVNDGLGHDAGDEILVQVASRLRSCVRDGDLVARIGGDEFVVVVHLTERREAAPMTERLLDVVREPVTVSGRRHVITMSIGVAFSDASSTPQTLMRDADAAVYRSKDKGRNQSSEFDDALRAAAIARLEVEQDLRLALDGTQLTVAYQPTFATRTGACAGVEALVRWHHPVRGVVGPGDFIPLAEDTGLIVPLGQRVGDVVAADHARGLLRGSADGFTVWVNVSGRELAEPRFEDAVRRRHEQIGGALGIEVTETVLHEDPTAAVATLQRIAAAGVKIAIDDFGTGYSSLARLTDYPIHLVKIDRSFVARVASTQHRAIVAAAIDLAHAVGAATVAEGVEDAEQLRGVRELGCDFVSGYHLARPVAAAGVATAIARGERVVATDAGLRSRW